MLLHRSGRTPRDAAYLPNRDRIGSEKIRIYRVPDTILNSINWTEERLRTAVDAAGIAFWSWNVVTDEVVLDDRAHELWDIPVNEPITFAILSHKINPDDLGRIRKAFLATRTLDGSYEIDFRILREGKPVWISARGQGRDAALVDNILYAVFMDVTERKQAEEVRELLAGEMSHRVKNLFAITAALTSMASRSTATKEEMERDLRRRITVLGNAHDFIRPVPGQAGKPTASLGDLFGVLLSPYDTEGSRLGRITIEGPAVQVGEAGASALALVAHELATNSVKYGALSTQNGSLSLSYSQDADEVLLLWTEHGGPPVADPQGRSGFGSKLVTRSLAGQLGGSLAVDWLRSGLVAKLRMNRARLAA